jgi:hypothetical protein
MKELKKFVTFSFFVVVFILFVDEVDAASLDPQYIFVRKNPMSCNPSDCSYLWNMDQPERINLDAINDIYNKVGTHGNDKRKLGIGVLVFYNQYSFNNIKASLEKLLVYSEVHNVPLYISFGGFQWIDNVPQFWNWWDPNMSGYDPTNRNNVEWTCWDSSCAIKKSWRNWGSEMEVKPHPNLASPEFVNHNKQKLTELIPIITNWYQGLPDDKKWLFGGMSVGVEVDVGGNYYYYPSGESNGQGIQDSVQLGYAAVKTAGIRQSGGPPTQSELNRVVRSYYSKLTQVALELGIPRNKIFSHASSDDFLDNSAADFVNRPDSSSGLNEFSNPGWSMYGRVTKYPQNYMSVLSDTGNSEWASPEWLTWATNYSGWLDALRNSLSYKNNRFINISNWEEIRGNQNALNALSQVLKEQPDCWVTSPQIDSIEVDSNQVSFSWVPGKNNESTYLNISNQNSFIYSGQLKNINIVNENVTNLTSYQKSGLNNGHYYWQLIADGCDVQRRRLNGSFSIGSTDSCQNCPSGIPKNKGNADCNSKINTLDFAEWRSVFKGDGDNKGKVDFNCSESDNRYKVNLEDLKIFIRNY